MVRVFHAQGHGLHHVILITQQFLADDQRNEKIRAGRMLGGPVNSDHLQVFRHHQLLDFPEAFHIRLISCPGLETAQNGFPFLPRSLRKGHPAVVRNFPVVQHGKQIHQAGTFRIPARDGQQPVKQGKRPVHGGSVGHFTLSLRLQVLSPLLQILEFPRVFFRQHRQLRLLVGVGNFLKIAGRINPDNIPHIQSHVLRHNGGNHSLFPHVQFRIASYHQTLQILQLGGVFRINGPKKAGPLPPLHIHQRIVFYQGVGGLDAGNVPEFLPQIHPVRNHFPHAEVVPVAYLDVRGVRKQIPLNFLLEASHDGQHDDEHHYPQRNAQQANQGNNGKESPQRVQIPQRQAQADVPAQ